MKSTPSLLSVALLSAIALVTARPGMAQVQASNYSQSDRDFLVWLNSRLETENISPDIMTDDAKIYSAKNFCGRIEQGTSASSLQQGFSAIAQGYDDPDSQRLMMVLSNSLLFGGLTYYCPQYLSQLEYAQRLGPSQRI